MRAVLLLLIAALFATAAKGADKKSESVTDIFQAKQLPYTTPDGKSHEVAYRLMAPEHIAPGKKYPLVVFLHGAGERGSDNTSQLKYLPTWMAAPEMRAKYPCFLLAPQCPNNQKWVNSPWDKKTSQPLPKDPADPMKQVIDMMDELMKTEPIDANRVYLTGLSMGGYGTWDLAERMPDRFAAVAPLCGGGDDTKVDRIVNVPLWCFHGDKDPAVPVERSREMIEALKKAGGHPKYTELPGVGHDCWTTAYRDPKGLIPWMFEQRKK
jgi:predicted peptidase